MEKGFCQTKAAELVLTFFAMPLPLLCKNAIEYSRTSIQSHLYIRTQFSETNFIFRLYRDLIVTVTPLYNNHFEV